MNNKNISQIGERELIRFFLKKRDKLLNDNESIIYKSYYDDAALEQNKSRYTVLSTDMLIQHTHFPQDMTYYQMGEKIVTVNVSDIMASNAIASSILISMALPGDMTLGQFDMLTNGILDKCREYDIKLIGGDINENDEIILSATAVGHIDEDVKLLSGIQDGDLVAVTGKLGSPAAGLDLIYNDMDLPGSLKHDLISSILEPTLSTDTFRLLHEHSDMITSMTDITDGLALELDTLKEKNANIGFDINYNSIPYDKYLKDVAAFNDKTIEDYILHFGEEFELLLTINPIEYEKYKQIFTDKLFIIGRCNCSGKNILIKDNKRIPIIAKGYEHLKQ
jgi:thiamine-monophosphate kinase